LAQLVGQFFTSIPLAERARLLEPLLRPLGVLSLVAVANGVFAKLRFRAGWPTMNLPLDEVRQLRASDVAALVDHVQQVSVDAIDGLLHVVASAPTSSAAAALLLTLLLRRRQAR
jgi:hypothetical protein